MALFTLTPLPRLGVTPLAGALVNTYAAGSSTPIATFTDSTGTIQNKNPVVADGFGLFPPIYLPVGQSYKYLYTSPVTNGLPPDPLSNLGAIIWTQDGIASIPVSASATDVTAKAGVTLSADQAVYLSDGSGALNAGQWYPADSANAYSSTLPTVGMTLAAVSAGGFVSVRISGDDPNIRLSLSAGSYYYIGSVGALTTVAPSNARVMGQSDGPNSIIIGLIPPIVPTVDNSICDGRLTLTTGVPVTAADVLAATTVYWAPYRGNRIALYNSTIWNTRTFPQLSIAVPATTASVYDVFVYDNAGTPALELSAAWNSDTAIFAAGVYASTRPLQDGVYVKSTNGTAIDATRRYVGSFRTTGVSGQTEDSGKKRHLSNYYNQKARTIQAALETTASWAYTTATWRQANANAANQLDVLIGMPEVCVTATVNAVASNNPGTSEYFVGIGYDSTSAMTSGCLPASVEGGNSVVASLMATLVHNPAIGRHTYVWLEQSVAGGTTTWYGQYSAATTYQAGIAGVLSGA